MFKIVVGFLFCSVFPITVNNDSGDNLYRAKQTLDAVLKYYDAGRDHLFIETWPYNEDDKVTYLAGDDTVRGKRVAYLWPTSGLFSATNALLKATGNKDYKDLLENTVLPGLEQYYDIDRRPACYQSYIKEAGKSDRFYDDNIWLGIDFLEACKLTGNKEYLFKAKEIWNFVISGWDDQIGGGIYWCEQKRKSKNTCSNAPAAVFAMKLYEATKDTSYLN